MKDGSHYGNPGNNEGDNPRFEKDIRDIIKTDSNYLTLQAYVLQELINHYSSSLKAISSIEQLKGLEGKVNN